MPPKPLWIACLPTCASSPPEPAGPWLARYGPHPIAYEGGWLLDVSGSQRLFGGRTALLRRLQREGQSLGWGRLGAAPTALAALALAHDTPVAGGLRCALGPDWASRLDALPIERLRPAHLHHRVLLALGLHTLGDLRRCPRAGLARRTTPDLLRALDALYGQAPWAMPQWEAPTQFYQTLELPAPTADAAALAFASQRLLGRLVAWLQERQAGVLHWRLGWQAATQSTALHFRHRQPTRDIVLLRQLLQDMLAQTQLDATVEGLWLETVHIAPWCPDPVGLLPGQPARDVLSWNALLERLSTRLGADRVQTVCLMAHWDPSRRQRWQAAVDDKPRDGAAAQTRDGIQTTDSFWLGSLWEPPWWLPQKRRLPVDPDGRPRLGGHALRRLLGPQRISTGWWDSPVDLEVYVASTADGRCWWLQRQRPRGTPGPGVWLLAGVYT